MTAESSAVALAAPAAAFTARVIGRRPRWRQRAASGSVTEVAARANTRSRRGSANRHPATTSAKETASYGASPAAKPISSPAASPHSEGSSKKFPLRRCSRLKRRSRSPGMQSSSRFTSQARGEAPTAKLWVKVICWAPVRRLAGAAKTSASSTCRSTIISAAASPYHITPVSCWISVPIKAACHRLHRSRFSTRVARHSNSSRLRTIAAGSR